MVGRKGGRAGCGTHRAADDRTGECEPVERRARADLRRAVVEASKQCGRNCLLEIGEPAVLAEYVSSSVADAVRWIAHPGGAIATSHLKSRGAMCACHERSVGGRAGGWFCAGGDCAGGTSGWQNVGLGAEAARRDGCVCAGRGGDDSDGQIERTNVRHDGGGDAHLASLSERRHEQSINEGRMTHDVGQCVSLELTVGEKILRSVLVYFFLLIGLRVAGKRELRN